MDLKDLIARLGPPTKPFGRRPNQNNEISEPELKLFESEDKSQNGSPEEDLSLLQDECVDIYKLPTEKKYLWIIDDHNENLRLRFIPEKRENNSKRGTVVHTNVTGGEVALQGGECWWCESSKTMYVNPDSGRYGAETKTQWNAVLEYFRSIGYTNTKDVLPSKIILKI